MRNHQPTLDYVKKRKARGDVLCVTRLDRLARSVRDLCRIIDTLKAKDAGLPTGKMMLTILGSIAKSEREIMLAPLTRPTRSPRGTAETLPRDNGASTR